MPVFYFDILDDGQAFPDLCGVEMADLFEARDQAQGLLPDLARDRLPKGNRRDLRVSVRCGDGKRCFTARLIVQSEWDEGYGFTLSL